MALPFHSRKCHCVSGWEHSTQPPLPILLYLQLYSSFLASTLAATLSVVASAAAAVAFSQLFPTPMVVTVILVRRQRRRHRCSALASRRSYSTNSALVWSFSEPMEI